MTLQPHQPPAYLGAATTSVSPDDATLRSCSSHSNSPNACSLASESSNRKKSRSKSPFPRLGFKTDDEHHKDESQDHAGPLPPSGSLQSKASRRGSFSGNRPRSSSNRSICYTDPQQASDLQRQSLTATQRNRCATPHYPASALSLIQTKSMNPEAIYIDWPKHDPANPFNWPKPRRWLLVSVCIFFTMCTALNAAGFPSAADAASLELGTTPLIYLLGNTSHLIAVAFTPMILAPLSEAYGRTPIYLVASFMFAILFIPQALAPNIATIIVARFFQGCAGSVGNSMVGGSVSDTFHAKERGFPMSLYALSVYLAQGITPALCTFTIVNHNWRIMFWWLGAVALLPFCLMCLLLKETRGPVLLSKRAKKLTNETGMLHRCRADDERASFFVMVRVSLIRPIKYLIMEPVVFSFSLWIGFLWGLVFVSLEAVPIVFSNYGWSQVQLSLVLTTLAGGGILGYLFNFHQERLYASQTQKHGGKPPGEARLFYACAGAVFAPIGLFIYAWTGRSNMHPSGPIIGLLIFNTALFPVYLAVFSYLADVYERYASSALAAQSFLRNMLAATFPLFSRQMYENLDPPIASTVLAVIATVLGVVPFILLRYGGQIRRHSCAATALEKEELEAKEFYEK